MEEGPEARQESLGERCEDVYPDYHITRKKKSMKYETLKEVRYLCRRAVETREYAQP